MSLILTFSGPGFTTAKYDDAIKQLQDAGAGAPKGRKYHVAYGDPENLHITDVWDDMEGFQAFGVTLMPIMQSLNVNPGAPQVLEVHNVIIG
jgi:hypothetical protein